MKRVALVCLVSMVFAACSARGGQVVPALPTQSAAFTLPPNVPTGAPQERLGAVQFDVALPLRNEPELDEFLAAVSDPASPSYGRFITREQFVERYAPARADLAAVAMDLRRAGFAVSVMDQAVAAGGSRAQIERYFGTRLVPSNGTFARSAAMRFSPALASRRATIVGLDGVQYHPFSEPVGVPDDVPHNFHSAYGPYYAADLKEAYQFPSYGTATGKGVTMAVIISSPVKSADIDGYFKAMGLKTSPDFTNQKVDGGGTYDSNSSSPGFSNTFEATLDVEQTLGMAPGAHDIIFNFPALYDNEIYDAYSAAIASKSVTAVNSSFGGCEAGNPFSAYASTDDLFKQGLAQGVTFVAASGDHGDASCASSADPSDLDVKGVNWPASSVYVLAVGGTNLKTQYSKGTNDSGYVSEEAYEDNLGGGEHWGSGGGYSKSGYYARPSWQNGFVTAATRGVPDVSLHMGGCPQGAVSCHSGYSADIEFLAGKYYYAIGTSASSPDFVGLIGLATQLGKKPFGDIHAKLYGESSLFRKGIKGNNGYATTAGKWDPVLGLGTPIDAYKIAGASSGAGVPGASSNP